MLYLKLLFLLSFIYFSTSTQANPLLEEQLSICGNEKNNSKRLSCFDEIIFNLKQSQSKNISSSKSNKNIKLSNWKARSTLSLLNNFYNIHLILDAENPVKSRTQTVTPSLELVCSEGISTLAINWKVYLGKNRTTIISRIDQEPPDKRDWTIKDKYTSINKTNNEKLISQLKSSKELVVKITPFNAEPIIATFKLEGLSQKLTENNLSCNWE